MTDVGELRTVDAKDLREFAYGGDSKHLKADLTNLRRQGLIVEREIPYQETAPRQLVALTKQGHRLLVATNNTPKDQALYHGFTKPRETRAQDASNLRRFVDQHELTAEILSL
jgi:DNA-binding HxlR family transcriptional regulator